MNMPITVAPINKELQVTKIIADKGTKKHLENLGFTGGKSIKILSQSGGSVICLVMEGRLALDSNIASKIFVSLNTKLN